MTENENLNGGAADLSDDADLSIKKTYIKDISFETPMGAKAFANTTQPTMKLDVSTRASTLEENTYEVILTLMLVAKFEEETAYLTEVQQAALFSIKGFPDEQLRHILAAVCPNFLFPYAREAIDGIVVKGGFPPVSLAPIDFDAIYRQSAEGAAAGGV